MEYAIIILTLLVICAAVWYVGIEQTRPALVCPAPVKLRAGPDQIL